MNPNDVIGYGALWAAIPLAMVAGLISFLSPCVLPLVPGYLGFIGGAVAPRGTAAGSAGKGRLLLGVLLFIAGFTVVFVAFTVIGGAAAVFLLEWNDLISRILGIVVILMGLIFLGLFGFAQREWRLRVNSATGLIGAPLLGLALGLGWAPCLGPTLTAIVAVSWQLGDPARAGLLGVAYALGLGVPFVLLALGLGWASRAVAVLRRHIRAINIAGGVLLILLGILMVTGVWTQIMSRLGAVMSLVWLPL